MRKVLLIRNRCDHRSTQIVRLGVLLPLILHCVNLWSRRVAIRCVYNARTFFLPIGKVVMLQIVEKACKFEADRSRGLIVVESDLSGPPFTEAFHELEGMGVVSLAQSFACSVGCAPAYLNGNKIGPYAVNSQGLSLDQVRDKDGNALPQTHPLMQPARYRMDIPVTRPIR